MSERVEHPIFSRTFAALVASPLGRALEKDRRRLLEGLTGRVVEVGAGTGASFAFYPTSVTEVVAFEPEPYLRAKASEAAAAAPVPVTVKEALAASLPEPDASFDAGVVSLVLCSVPSQADALAEMRRVVKPGGELRFYEHVVAPDSAVLARLQGFVDKTFWPKLMGNCHSGRDTVKAIEDAGFTIESLHRSEFKIGPLPTPVTPHAAGIARRV